MNRALRKSHLRRVVALALLLPIGIGAALLERPEPELFVQADAAEARPTASDWSSVPTHSLGGALVQARLKSIGSGAIQSLEVRSDSSLAAPDVLLYWLEGDEGPSAGDELPHEVVLLGPFSGERPTEYGHPLVPLPGTGSLIFYSLAHAELLGSIPLSSEKATR